MPVSKIYGKQSSPCLCTNTRRASRAVTAFYDQHLKANGISISQLNLLIAVKNAQQDNFQQLAEKLRLDRTTLNRNLKPLCDKGMIVIEKGKDAREKRVRLLDKGASAVETALRCWEQAQQDIIDYLGVDDFTKLNDLLLRLESLVP